MKWILIVLVVAFLLHLTLNAQNSTSFDKAIALYDHTDGSYTGGDALTLSIRNKKLDIDLYAGAYVVYIEWDEKNLPISYINIYKNGDKKFIKRVYLKASDIGHRWNFFIDNSLKPSTKYSYRVELVLMNNKKIYEDLSFKTKKSTKKREKRAFKIYDDLEGRSGKEQYLKKYTKTRTMKSFGLENSAMFWVDDFFYPIPSYKDADPNRIKTQPQIKTLQKLVKEKMNSKYLHNRVDPNGGFIMLDIEHVPTNVSYVEKEFSPYGSLISKMVDSKKVTKNGRKIVSRTIAKKLKSIKAVKDIYPNTKVGLWDSIVSYNRYNEGYRNRDYNALAKGVDNSWLINYDEWHNKDTKIYKAFIDVVDFVSPALYPAFSLKSYSDKKKQIGMVLSRLMEIKRLNPDAIVIPSISPHYTEGWAYHSGIGAKPVEKGVFKWYLDQLYQFYKDGLIDSIEIWGDNEKTDFQEYPKQDWWGELWEFSHKK